MTSSILVDTYRQTDRHYTTYTIFAIRYVRSKSKIGRLYVSHETAICRNPPINSFTRYRKNLADTL